MKEDDFKDIAPFEGKDFDDAVSRLIQYPQLLNNFTDIISRHNRVVNKWKSFHAKKLLAHMLTQVHNYTEFQEFIVCDIFLEMIESSSIENFTFDGIEQLGLEDKPHIYISNHRDIVLDTALLDLALYRSNNRKKCEMVIGDNLLVNQFAIDLFKTTGAITVKRSLSSTSELRTETLRLSRYMRHCVQDKDVSLWIAQKSGRSKDGIDNTSPAIIKMLYLAYREDGISFTDFIDSVSIVPVAISYQYDPCDISKSEEQIRKLKAEGVYDVYKKKKYADVLDLVRGLRMYKGNVHMQVGTPLNSKTVTDPRSAVREIDRQIHTNYKLWDTNYFAYDYINGTDRFADKYTEMNTKGFVKHYKHLKDDVRDFVFREYANPVISMLDETEATDEQK
ncbi:MAG: 1-acyl-sn-glycerol-3-phosphate acyltransferase [Spirochaetales bacterium]|nr:1-acyl-sn-glycerol-3-phosphate acyltransferase [Spirochaetales bacterium]MBR4426863.1 1-acyl-sn-glycerol-3-phosphate acyltransferase [Spirochaetales bacterium]